MNIKEFVFNPFQENTYVLYDETLECIIVDPGCYDQEEEEMLASFIEMKQLKPITYKGITKNMIYMAMGI